MGNDFNITAGNSLSLPMSIFSHQGGTLSNDDQDEQRLLRSWMETHVFLEICLGHEALSLCSHLYEFKENLLQEKYLQQKKTLNLTKKDHLKMIVGNVPAFIYFWISGFELIPANIFIISLKTTLNIASIGTQ